MCGFMTKLFRVIAIAMCMVLPAAADERADSASFAEFDRRARAGEELTVVFFGASLTWGANATDQALTSYRARTKDLLEARYPKARFRCYDAAIGGTVLAAFLCERVGRRPAYAWLCVASLVSVAWLYFGNARWGTGFLLAMFLANGATSSFYGWFPLAFPEWFPTSVRASAQGFAFNFGRVIAAVGSLQTAALVGFFGAGLPAERIEVEGFPRAAICLSAVYLVGLAIVWLAPETRGRPLPP